MKLVRQLAIVMVVLGFSSVGFVAALQEDALSDSKTTAIPDLRKVLIGRPLEEALASRTANNRKSNASPPGVADDSQPDNPVFDVRKRFIENPMERLVGSRVTPRVSAQDNKDEVERSTASSDGLDADDSESTNPTVTPGLVRWHDDFEAACRASQDSGKPVLLFQLLGQLDQEFT